MKTKLVAIAMAGLMAVQSVRAGDSQTPEPKNPKPEWLMEAIVAMIFFTVVTVIFVQLHKTCKRKLANPPNPPPDDQVSTNSGTIGQMTSIPIAPDASCCWNITNQTPNFQTPSGSYYDSLLAVSVETSTNLIDWQPCGQVTAWVSDDYIKIQQFDTNGISLSVTTIKDWQISKGLPLFSSTFPPSDKRFFRQTPTYK